MKARTLTTPILAILAAVILWAAIGGIGATAADDPPATTTITTTVTTETTIQGKTAAGWHRVAGRYLTSVRALNRRAPLWGGSWLEGAFGCIHSFEGRWTDPAAPYYGGLQMDVGFQRTYGDWALRAFGTADHWPISVQIATAIRAWASGRGFYPWPNTARYCGLIR
jgi:hypothetical protein